MAYGYVIVQVNVTDAEAYKAYAPMAQQSAAGFGGEYLARGGPCEHCEGSKVGDRNVIIRFPSLKAAQDWYQSDEYAEAKSIRQAAATSNLTIVEGVE